MMQVKRRYLSPMLGRTYEREVCSAARALEVVGERWSLLILRNAAFAGCTRFTDFQQRLGVAPNILSARLALFVDEGLMDTVAGESGHLEYRLTAKGRELTPAIVALTAWGDRWAAPDGPPIAYGHAGCDGTVTFTMSCTGCGAPVSAHELTARPTVHMPAARQRRRLP